MLFFHCRFVGQQMLLLSRDLAAAAAAGYVESLELQQQQRLDYTVDLLFPLILHFFLGTLSPLAETGSVAIQNSLSFRNSNMTCRFSINHNMRIFPLR